MVEDKSKNDMYHEQLDKHMSGLSQEELIERIKKCQAVVDKLDGDPIWQTVISDARMWVRKLDASWQEVYDEKSLNNLRVLKFAYRHLDQLPNKYRMDLTAAQKALDALRNTDSSVQKDYDLETQMEPADAT